MIDAQQLIDSLKKQDLTNYEDVVTHTVAKWINQIEEIQASASLKEHFIIKNLIEKFRQKIIELDRQLLTQRKLPEMERELILDRKELYQEFITEFDTKHQLEEMERKIRETFDTESDGQAEDDE